MRLARTVRLVVAIWIFFAACSMVPAQTGLVPGGVVQAKPPLFPPEAKARGRTGSVLLRAVITRDGLLRDIRVVSGPDLFREYAINAANSWKYKPYILNGSPVDYETTIRVNFNMSKQQKAAAKAAAQEREPTLITPERSEHPTEIPGAPK